MNIVKTWRWLRALAYVLLVITALEGWILRVPTILILTGRFQSTKVMWVVMLLSNLLKMKHWEQVFKKCNMLTQYHLIKITVSPVPEKCSTFDNRKGLWAKSSPAWLRCEQANIIWKMNNTIGPIVGLGITVDHFFLHWFILLCPQRINIWFNYGLQCTNNYFAIMNMRINSQWQRHLLKIATSQQSTNSLLNFLTRRIEWIACHNITIFGHETQPSKAYTLQFTTP